MDDYTVPLDRETGMSCTLLLFKDVKNSKDIRRKVMNGELTCSVVKAALVADPLQAIVAANKAAVSSKMNQLTTKSIYTELLFNLSISKNISRALTEFGINDNDSNILIALIHKKDDKSMLTMIVDSVKGERVSISELSKFTNYELIRKAYKIEDEELNVSSFANSIVSRISCKDFMSVK